MDFIVFFESIGPRPHVVRLEYFPRCFKCGAICGETEIVILPEAFSGVLLRAIADYGLDPPAGERCAVVCGDLVVSVTMHFRVPSRPLPQLVSG